jgi:hypothetical protein
MWNESTGPSDHSEADIRANIAELESQRISLREAYRGSWRVMFGLGHARVAWASIAIFAGAFALGTLTQSPLPIVAGFVVLAGAGIYADSNLEDWVEEHNADIDAQIRRRLHDPDEET